MRSGGKIASGLFDHISLKPCFMLASLSLSLDRIGPSGRRFLSFASVNIIAVHCVSSGALLVLFARHIEMPASLVGLLMSFMPLSAMFVVFTNPLVERLGPRRLMMRTWIVRNLLFGTIFLTPLAIAWWGNPAGWAVLCFSTLGFSLTRAMGMGGWFPWLHEILPPRSRGMYFALEQSLLQGTSIVLSILIALWLGSQPTVGRFLVVMGFGMSMGIFSETLIRRIPGGGRYHDKIRPIRESFGEYRHVLADRRFLRFAGMTSLGVCAMTWLSAASILYLRDMLHYSSNHILFLSAASGLCVALTIRRWGAFSDAHGSGKTLSLCLAGSCVAGLGWFALVPYASWTDYLVWPVVILTSIFGAAYWSGTNRAMLCTMKSERRIPYTNAWVIARSAAVGFTPIAAGFLIDHFHFWGYMTCFCLGVILSVTGAVAVLGIREDEGLPVPLRALLQRQARPLRVLWQIGGILLAPSDYTSPQEDLVEEDEKVEEVPDEAGSLYKEGMQPTTSHGESRSQAFTGPLTNNR